MTIVRIILLGLAVIMVRECFIYSQGGPTLFRLVDPHPITCRPSKRWAWDCIPLAERAP